MHKLAIVTAAIVLLVGLSGCGRVDRALSVFAVGWSSGGELLVEGRTGERNILEADFDRCLYSLEDNRTITAVLIDGHPRGPRQAVVLRLLWMPEAGSTPLDPKATNLTITHIIFSGEDQIGIYAGAGFLLTAGEPGDELFGGRVRDASLKLTDHTEDFIDQLGLSTMTGSFLAQRDDAAVGPMLRQLNQLVRERLGRARLVQSNLPLDQALALLPTPGN